MKPAKPGQPVLLSEKNNSGFILLITVIIMAALLSVILIKISLSTISFLEQQRMSWRGAAAKHYTEGCLQEALIQLNRDHDYASGTLNLAGGSCEINLAGDAASKTITIEGNLNNYYYNLTATVTLTPFSLVSWDN